MCFESRALASCGCQATHHHVCLEYILHTHQQLDNKPCPKYALGYFTSKRMCVGECQKLSEDNYTFEAAGESLADAMARANQQREEAKQMEKKTLSAPACEHGDESGDAGGGKRVKKEEGEDEMQIKKEADEDDMKL